jgi:hypothetical protein
MCDYPFAASSYEKPDIEQIIYYFSDKMPTINIEHPRLRREMRDALKRHILRESQRKKIGADKQRRKEEKVCLTKIKFSFIR